MKQKKGNFFDNLSALGCEDYCNLDYITGISQRQKAVMKHHLLHFILLCIPSCANESLQPVFNSISITSLQFILWSYSTPEIC